MTWMRQNGPDAQAGTASSEWGQETTSQDPGSFEPLPRHARCGTQGLHPPDVPSDTNNRGRSHMLSNGGKRYEP
ncbi:hypothetical protein SHKM778_83570 [Streptomyces sp. KM77-8]|uniref:Uncharacterized protein n=1 Tax=Streptomyces haneummycinicus TaxID=3074435 RepID=A0AAT9HWG7_9ACTN